MRILIDIGHPAHVHYFRNLIHELNKLHRVFVTTKNIDLAIYLLKHYGIDHEVIGNKGDSLVKKVVKQAFFTARLVNIIKRQRIDLVMGVSVSVAQAAKICGTVSLYFDDDDLKASPLTAYSGTPFATTVLSPDVLSYENTKSAIYYPGYHELAYLHPKYFIPNPSIAEKYILPQEGDYFILRFNAFKAHHDIHEGGMNIEQKRRLVKLLSGYGRVFITTEARLDKEFEMYKVPITPEDMHDFIASASMLVSDSQTMTSEAAVLGVPSFRCNSFAGRLSVLEEEEKRYRLTKAYLPRQFDWMFEEIKEHLQYKDVRSEWDRRRQRMLNDKIDVTSFWLWFLENYPESKHLIKNSKFDYNQYKGIDCNGQ